MQGGSQQVLKYFWDNPLSGSRFKWLLPEQTAEKNSEDPDGVLEEAVWNEDEAELWLGFEQVASLPLSRILLLSFPMLLNSNFRGHL